MNSTQRFKEKDTEFVEKLVSVRRVSKVRKGGKSFCFSVLVVVGDAKGLVGYAVEKAQEVPDAVRKATESAKKKMVRIPLKEGRTLHHYVYGKMKAAKVYISSAPAGKGIIAGGPMRAVFEALGVHDVTCKSFGSRNPINMVHATVSALQKIVSPRRVAQLRGKKITEIFGVKENAI